MFKDEMTWDNYGDWHLDHIKPLCLFDLSNRDDIGMGELEQSVRAELVHGGSSVARNHTILEISPHSLRSLKLTTEQIAALVRRVNGRYSG